MDKNFQTVFDDAVEVEKSFDTMFGGEEDDDLIGIVLGESGDEEVDFETLDDGETADELKKDLEGEEIEKPTIDSNGSFDIEDDAKTPGEDIACTKFGVADAVEKKAPDETNIEDEIDKSESKSDIDDLEESAFLDMIFGEEADPGEPEDLGVEKDQIEDNDEAEKLEDNPNPVNATEDEEEKVQGLDDTVKEGDGCEDGSCVAPDEAPVAYDHPVEDENLDDTFKDDDDDDDDDEDDDEEPVVPSDDGEVAPAPVVNDDVQEEGCCGKAKKEEGEDIPDPASDEGDEASLPPVEESSLDNIFGLFKEADEAATDEKVEDEIIDAVEEDEGELSDEELAELTDDEDEDLLDMIIGEE